MSSTDGPLPPLAPGAPSADAGLLPEAPVAPSPSAPWSGAPPAPWASDSRTAPPRPGSAPRLFPAVGWCGFGLAVGSIVTALAGAVLTLVLGDVGLALGSLLAPVAGAGLALSLVGLVQARAAGRLVAPPVLGAAAAFLAVAINVVVVVLSIAGGLTGTDDGYPSTTGWTAQEDDFLDALASHDESVYLSADDEFLIEDGRTACGELAKGATSREAAGVLAWDRPSQARAIVGAATGTLCDAAGGPLGSGGSDGSSSEQDGSTS